MEAQGHIQRIRETKHNTVDGHHGLFQTLWCSE